MALLVVGTVAFDSIETPFGKAERIVGGAATYICHAAANFTNNIHLVSVVGDDFPKEEVAKLEAKGIDTKGLQTIPGGKSFFWSGKYHHNMNQRDTLETQLNVLADFDPVLPQSYKNPDYVMLGNLTPAVQMRVLDQLESKPKLVMLDTMNFWIDIALDDLKKVIARVDVLTINDEEARMLSGESSLVKAAKLIHAMGPKYVVVKKGEHGALLFSGDHVFFAPALPLEEVFDPTGAGDTFAGGMIGYLANADDVTFDNLKRGIIVGSALASFCVEKFGITRIDSLTQAEIDGRLKEFIELVQFDIDLIG